MGATLPALARQVEEVSVAGIPLRREHRRRRVRMPAFRFLFAARVRRGHGDLRRRGDQRGGCRDRVRTCGRQSGSTDSQVRAHEPRGSADAIVYVAIALSGLCALGAEAIWTRMLGLLFGASVYTLSIIVAVFLTGLGIGSGIGSLLCRSPRAPAPRVGLVPVARWPPRSPGPRTASLHRSPTGRSTPPSLRTSGSPFSSTSPARFGPCCRRRSCGARASRWRSRPPDRRRSGWRPGYSRESTPPTRWEPSSARSARACS